MNTKGANTEPFYQFVRAHEDLGTSIKLAYGALYAISQDERRWLPAPRVASLPFPLVVSLGGRIRAGDPLKLESRRLGS